MSQISLPRPHTALPSSARSQNPTANLVNRVIQTSGFAYGPGIGPLPISKEPSDGLPVQPHVKIIIAGRGCL